MRPMLGEVLEPVDPGVGDVVQGASDEGIGVPGSASGASASPTYVAVSPSGTRQSSTRAAAVAVRPSNTA